MHQLSLGLVLFSITTAATAFENIVVLASDDKNTIELNGFQQEYIYGKVVAHLATCSIGNPPNTQLASKENLENLHSKKHIELQFPSGAIKIPIGNTLSEVSGVFILFESANAPARVVKMSGNILQFYSKCSGYSALYSFTCDDVISKIMSVGSKNTCNRISTEYKKQL
jgi:hypothetical protein